MNIDTGALGSIITNHKARAVVYGIYVILALAAASAQVAYAALKLADPAWLVAGIAVLAFLGAPIGALALANVRTAPADLGTTADGVAVITTLPAAPTTASPTPDTAAQPDTPDGNVAPAAPTA